MPAKDTSIHDDLEERIKNLCYDHLPKASIRSHYSESTQRKGILSPGAKFVGWQSGAENQRYEVNVEIQDVNLNDSSLCGYLTICNLTTEYPELTTFFEAEIIGEKHPFLTRKWDADDDQDRAHWTKFHGFSAALEASLHDRNYSYDFRKEQYIFMRWKELFLVPDHHVNNLNGASYEGFYYICADLQNEIIDGFYFHKTSDRFQRLDLQYIRDRKFESFEFRYKCNALGEHEPLMELLERQQRLVFVDPEDERIPYWWPAIIVVEKEYELFEETMESEAASSISPDERLVCYFEDGSFSVVPKSALIPFDPTAEPFKSYSRNISHFRTDAGIRRALMFHDHGKIPKMFKWLQLAETGYLDVTAAADDSDLDQKQSTKLKLATK